MIDKLELIEGIGDMVERLEALEAWVIELQRELIHLQAAQRAAQATVASIEALSMPLTPATATQGWLAQRFQRRDGTVYGPGATQADAEINSAVRGGDEASGSQPTRRDI